ncbi:expansin-like A2 [Cajanus cajan]|uniref:Expansin-like A1 n=1 Tax=Cajanus cajan TaxID=3821 RepID=A0A151T7F8_CAJCA|nr:expansin-like A2 [Cajanus cajan]KYP62992.1 Expansin-like A1 [Cajanus cajan]
MTFFTCFFFFLLASSATACDRCLQQSKASYFSKASALSSGACGYGSLALGLSGGHLAAGVASLFKDGAGCGACFQIRCKNPTVCSKEGTRVVLTDLNHNNKTDFVLSSRGLRGSLLLVGMVARVFSCCKRRFVGGARKGVWGVGNGGGKRSVNLRVEKEV